MEKRLARVTEIQADGSPEGNVSGVNPSVVLISPNEGSLRLLRRSVEAQRATLVREFTIYPGYAHVDGVAGLDCDAFIVEIDSDFEVALDFVEALCTRRPFATVMTYSDSGEQERIVRSMRAGAREFLVGAVTNQALQDALLRAAARRSQQAKKVSGSTAVFWGSKGGCGVTTVAANFAIALRMETAAEVVLLDLNPRLGDAAALLGLTPQFTVAEALKHAKRLDQEFLSTLVIRHDSGISVLAAPDIYSPTILVEDRAVGRLVDIARNRYPYVVIDAGRDLGAGIEALVQMASIVYLVTQLDVLSLRNSQRLLSYIGRAGAQSVELVINRFEAKRTEFDDERITKALGIAPTWKIPNDYAAARRTSNTGNPLVHEKSAVASELRAMARAAAGKPATTAKRKGFGWFS
jgi:pilus assembly protein CpaE